MGSPTRIRVQVDTTEPRAGAIVYLDPAEVLGRLTRRQRAAVESIVEQAVEDLAARTGRTKEWARLGLLSELVLLWVDDQAYRREAERRGVLAL